MSVVDHTVGDQYLNPSNYKCKHHKTTQQKWRNKNPLWEWFPVLPKSVPTTLASRKYSSLPLSIPIMDLLFSTEKMNCFRECMGLGRADWRVEGELQQVLGEVQDLESKTRHKECQLREVGKLPWATEKTCIYCEVLIFLLYFNSLYFHSSSESLTPASSFHVVAESEECNF